MLHESIRRQDEIGREQRSSRRDPDGGKVQFLRDAIPAKDPNPQECALQEECNQTFHSKRRSENISHEAAIGRPVHTKLELLNNPSYNADSEVNKEELSKEFCGAKILIFIGSIPSGLQPGDEKTRADSDWNEDEVINGGDTELPSGKV